MTTRLDVDVDDTKALLGAILKQLNQDRRCMFLIEPGRGDAKIQAVRTALTRVRARLKRQGKRLKHFNMHSSIHPHTENAKRYDMVVVWRSQSQRHAMVETLEDLVGNGAEL